MLTQVPIFGVEGSPATAAMATANLRTANEYHFANRRQVGSSQVLPFTLAAGKLQSIEERGGVCFSQVTKEPNNIGGRSVTTGMNCPPSDAAGATTLSHALQGLVKSLPPEHSACPAPEWPGVYLAKVDIEGSEFKALS